MPYGPAAIALVELPYSAIIASFVLVLVCTLAADAAEPSISEPAGVAVGAGAAGVVDRKLAKGSVSAWCDGGDMSIVK